ncbi:hypothetical protein [Crateriforma conspicua]|uniref:hypothetical protein n=1 Tax=Crateriforma conspicua TaxID=2527996 RepID=UPI00118AB168|nr:hypothetical protein [Crateriforma conspicua]QDV62302.1 hypothetical protein Mal65_14360 [Crateriforma conspicua]
MSTQHHSLPSILRLACYCSLLWMKPPAPQAIAADETYDIVVYGGTPADTCGTRGDNIIGQYYEAFPGHTARLDETLSRQTGQRWESLAKRRGIKVPVVTDSVTRGEWLRLTLIMGQTSPKTARQRPIYFVTR